MEIRNCPECHDEVVSAGAALWDDFVDEVEVFECMGADCGWAGIELELTTRAVLRSAA
jgi:hypothetical protein